MARSPLVLLSILTSLVPVMAWAAEPTRSGEFSAQRFEPAPGPRNFVTLPGLRMEGNMTWSGGLFLNYAASPITLPTCTTSADCAAKGVQPTDLSVVSTLVTAHALVSVSPTPRLQLGLRVPVTFTHGDGIDTTTGLAQKKGLSGSGLGDPAVEAKARLHGSATTPAVLGAAAFVSFPVGHAVSPSTFLGDSSPVIGVRGLFDAIAGPWDLGLSLGGIYRGTERVSSVELGPAARFSAAAAYRMSPVLRLVVEGFGESKFSGKRGTNALEALGAINISPLDSGLTLLAGVGPGIVQGVGVPDVRAFLGVSYTLDRTDTDGDGIPDVRDGCVSDPEDFDGFQDDDGCPDPDNDQDKILDLDDKCPNEPETYNGFMDEDGCPDTVPDTDGDGIPDAEDMCPKDGGPTVIRAKGKFYGCPDRDKDGIPDKLDKCPDEPEDTDGFEDDDGCPDPDNDQDGILDPEDECVDIPGTKENHGCPDKDTDGDGIPDRLDRCPDKPETYNGFQDEDGCPDKAPGSLIDVTDDGIRIKEQVQFDTASDKIVGAKSFKILDQIAAVLKANQTIFVVEVAGHTDNAGDSSTNKALSQKRAEAVRAYLIEKRSVPPKKLTAAGYGDEKPIADNATAKGKQANRRVEFIIVKSTKRGPGTSPPPTQAK